MRDLMARLGRPERGFPAVLVAGTKGKGSTAAMLASIAQAAGLRVGLYSKPHLVDFRERVRVNGALISPGALATLIDDVRRAIELGRGGPGWPPTYFEVSAALSFLHFTRLPVDLGVVEVGIGGRLDACNVVDPLVSVITTIGHDHVEIVGRRLRQIAFEDTGIMRPSRFVVTVAQRRAAAAVLRAAAGRLSAEMIQVGRQVRYRTLASTPAGVRVTVRGRRQTYSDLAVPLLGRHQAQNAAAAIAAAEALAEVWDRSRGGLERPLPELSLGEGPVREGLARLRWPARIEVVRDEPTTIVDVAHNPVSFRALRATLDEVFPGRRLLLVIGVVGTKDLAGIARIIGPRASVVVATRAHDPRALPAETVAGALRPWAPEVHVVEEPVEAVDHAVALAASGDVVCATGSFHVAGPIRAHLVGRVDGEPLWVPTADPAVVQAG